MQCWMKIDDQDQDDRRNIDAAQVGQHVADRTQHRLGDPVKKLRRSIATNWLRVFTTLNATSQRQDGRRDQHARCRAAGQIGNDRSASARMGNLDRICRTVYLQWPPLGTRRQAVPIALTPRTPRRKWRPRWRAAQSRIFRALVGALGAVAQLGERLVRNEEVRGSIPLGSTSLRRFAATAGKPHPR